MPVPICCWMQGSQENPQRFNFSFCEKTIIWCKEKLEDTFVSNAKKERVPEKEAHSKDIQAYLLGS